MLLLSSFTIKNQVTVSAVTIAPHRKSLFCVSVCSVDSHSLSQCQANRYIAARQFFFQYRTFSPADGCIYIYITFGIQPGQTSATMSHMKMEQGGMPHDRRRSSLFDIAPHRKPTHCGSSIMSFAAEPRGEEERQKKVLLPYYIYYY